ncbi:unnamed protein product [Paramecium sonneborni]|uniref:Uncharacterized protein n=1 Tax=Paramecium sonneborni TaxID=65129 RepID=A0A8S1RSN7_9CILI|nr:unnamed protein product [Paramecium sonneborni]
MTPLLKSSLQENLKPITINYLNSSYSQTIYVDKNTLACELIVRAIQEYKKNLNFDQSLLKYSNFTLAYKLTSIDDFCDFSAYPSFKDSIIDKKSVQEDEHQQFQYIFDNLDRNFNRKFFYLELNSHVDFKNLTLEIADTSSFGIDLLTIEITHKTYPTQIILLLEDIKNKIFYNLKFEENATIQDIYNQLQKKGNFKCNQNECFFLLKYPCVNVNNLEPLDIKFPISLLPIHWLIIQYKYDQKNTISSSSNNLNDCFMNSELRLSSIQIISPSIIQKDDYIDRKNVQMFNYKEYKLIKLENNESLNKVIVELDYFDLYYYQTSKKQQKYFYYKIAKGKIQFLLISILQYFMCHRLYFRYKSNLHCKQFFNILSYVVQVVQSIDLDYY